MSKNIADTFENRPLYWYPYIAYWYLRYLISRPQVSPHRPLLFLRLHLSAMCPPFVGMSHHLSLVQFVLFVRFPLQYATVNETVTNAHIYMGSTSQTSHSRTWGPYVTGHIPAVFRFLCSSCAIRRRKRWRSTYICICIRHRRSEACHMAREHTWCFLFDLLWDLLFARLPSKILRPQNTSFVYKL